MPALVTFLLKDLRLLWRDRAGLIFLLVAPLIVISVAGFSLANLYGADPSGQTAYEFPVADEDGGRLGQQIRERLAHDPAVHLQVASSREAAQELVRSKRAGTALVIPRGTDAALAAGTHANLLLYSDPVKYLERINLRTRRLELGDALTGERAAQLAVAATSERDHVAAQLTAVQAAVADGRAKLEAAWHDAEHARAQVIDQLRQAAARERAAALAQVKQDVRTATFEMQARARRQLETLRSEFRTYVDSMSTARREFEQWLQELRRLAGSHAGDVPPPPHFPELPPALQQIVDGTRPPVDLSEPDLAIDVPSPPLPQLPPMPAMPAIDIPHIELPKLPPPLPSLGIEEVNLTGGPAHINTFDQNVPGFAVTFLMLGMLLEISLGLLDERE